MIRTLTGRMARSLVAAVGEEPATERCPPVASVPTSVSAPTWVMPRRRWWRPSRALAGLPGLRLHGVSRLYATAPVGVTDQPEFRNAAVALDVPAGPDAVDAARCRCSAGSRTSSARSVAVDDGAGAHASSTWTCSSTDAPGSPSNARAAARSLDDEGDPAKASKLLVVPHPAAAARLFVLAPLADLAPGLVPPGWGRSVETARRRQLEAEGPAAVRVVGDWDRGSTALGAASAQVAACEGAFRSALPPDPGSTR